MVGFIPRVLPQARPESQQFEILAMLLSTELALPNARKKHERIGKKALLYYSHWFQFEGNTSLVQPNGIFKNTKTFTSPTIPAHSTFPCDHKSLRKLRGLLLLWPRGGGQMETRLQKFKRDQKKPDSTLKIA